MIRNYNTEDLSRLYEINYKGIENASGVTVRIDNPALCNYYSNITAVKDYVGNYSYDQELSYWDYEFVNNFVLNRVVKMFEEAIYNTDKELYNKAITILGKENIRLDELLNEMVKAKTNKTHLPKISSRTVFSILTDYFGLEEIKKVNSSKWVPIDGLKDIIEDTTEVVPGKGHIY